MTLSKTEKIMALFNQWDPAGRHADGEGLRSYSYEADTIAQSIRKNSKPERVETMIREMFSDIELDDREVGAMAGYILGIVKQG